MKKIQTACIIGMGALGMLFGKRIYESLGEKRFCFLMDEARRDRFLKNGFLINGESVSFPVETQESLPFTPDLVIIATKENGLDAARDMALSVCADHTVFISLLNGITSEEILREKLGNQAVIDCVAIGMDAVREGNVLTYTNMGRLQIGSEQAEQEEALKALSDFFTLTGIPHEVSAGIRKAMWNKFMINVGVNQTCMVYNTTYGGATKDGSAALSDMIAAMREVMAVAREEGVLLTEEDLENDLKLLRSLNPDGCPSMQQDALAGRKSEVNLFAGTLIEKARRHSIPTPVNERYWETIREMESHLL